MVALFAQRNLNEVSSVSSREFEMYERADRMNMVNNGLDGRGTVAMPGHFDIVGTDVAYRRYILSIGVIRRLDLEIAETGSPFSWLKRLS